MIDQQTLQQVVIDVCNTMLALGIVPTTADSMNEETETANIRITGAVESCVEVEATQGMCRQIASAMFDTEADSLSEEEILDALGETVNIFGGNIKGIFPGESSLSLPCVGQNKEAAVESARPESIDVFFAAQDEVIAVKFFDYASVNASLS